MFSTAACLILPPNFLAGKLCRATGETAGLHFCFWVSQDFLPAPSKEWWCTFWWVLKNRTRLEMIRLHFYFYLKGVISACVLVRCLSPVGLLPSSYCTCSGAAPAWPCCLLFWPLKFRCWKRIQSGLYGRCLMGNCPGPPPWLSSASRVLPMDKQPPGPRPCSMKGITVLFLRVGACAESWECGETKGESTPT